ncbi:stalk domain-containing protein [Thermanaeromonas sp. C210]|uniref:stalk domain-containing protein n=1 Tax=Thermanaeromonas sp. C210 TaxID=2731925 RepID=UPI00155B7711|nr:stalk domain-containing protein [Thermanaeromonas sp. C210]GFN21775.1 copper amine oxidase-like protein [Thermanaeromonas sp. C210]
MQSKRRILWFAAALILALGWYLADGYWGGREVHAGGPLPGSSEDPLVTKSYVDDKIQQLQKALEQAQTRLNTLEGELAALKKKLSEAPAAGATQVILTIGSRTAFVNGTPVELPVAPFQDAASGTAMVPFRFVGESLGAAVSYDGRSQEVNYALGSRKVVLKPGSLQADINGVMETLPSAPRLVNGITMVPLRVVSQGLGAEVSWHAAARAITITLIN